jgi:hypothetical protein
VDISSCDYELVPTPTTVNDLSIRLIGDDVLTSSPALTAKQSVFKTTIVRGWTMSLLTSASLVNLHTMHTAQKTPVSTVLESELAWHAVMTSASRTQISEKVTDEIYGRSLAVS